MSKKLIACLAVFAVAIAAVVAGTSLAARSAAKANGCCYTGLPCCEADCCYEGSPCCYPGSPCCGDCCVEGAACCTEGAASCTTPVVAADTPKADAKVGEGCCKAGAKKDHGREVKAGHCGGCEKCFVDADRVKAAPAADATVIAVEDMECPSCAKKVVKTMNEVPGVAKVVADTKASRLTVTPKAKAALSAKAMWEAVEKAGFKPTRLEGPAGKFTALPKE